MLMISEAELQSIKKHAESAYPNECCGVLLGSFESGGSRIASAAVPCENTRADRPHDRYNIADKQLVRIQRQARESGQEIVGFYHSHPDHPAQWSQTDLDEAHWIGCSYVITSVQQGHAEETRSFMLAGRIEEEKRFVEEELICSSVIGP